MERDEFKVIAARLRGAYPKDFMPDQLSFDTWFVLLKDLPTVSVEAAALRYMQTSRFSPTPADIRGIAAEITTPPEEDVTEDEAVIMLEKAVSRSGYYSEEEFAKLPVIMQRVIVNPARLKEMSVMDTEKFQSVELSHFRRSFRAEKERMRQEAMISPEVVKKIEKIRQDTIGAKKTEQLEAS